MRLSMIRWIFAAFFVVCSTLSAYSFEAKWVRIPDGIRDRELNCIAASLKNPDTIYVGTDKRLYKSEDRGFSWKEVFSCRGEYQGVNDIFIGRGREVYIATKNGIFRSADGQNDWKEIFNNAFFGSSDIVSLAMDADSSTGYVLTPSALFKTKDNGSLWEKIFSSSPDSEVEDSITEEDDEDITSVLRKVRLDRYGNVYLAMNKGLIKSNNGGISWEAITDAGVYSGGIEDCIVSDMHLGTIYVAADKGVFEYAEDGTAYRNLYSGLENIKAKDLSFGSKSEDFLWCIADNRIYRTLGESGEAMLYGTFQEEPTVRRVQEMAIKYAEVSPEKIRKWRRDALLRAILPKITFGIDNSASDTYEIYTNSNTSYSVVGPKDFTEGWDIAFTWDLGDLIYNDAQTSIDSRSKLMVQLREDILNSVTRLYFERRRLQLELLANPPDVFGKAVEKEMRIQEVTASIDALTDGEFSKAIRN